MELKSFQPKKHPKIWHKKKKKNLNDCNGLKYLGKNYFWHRVFLFIFATLKMITCSHNEIIQEYKFKEIQNMIIRIKKKKGINCLLIMEELKVTSGLWPILRWLIFNYVIFKTFNCSFIICKLKC